MEASTRSASRLVSEALDLPPAERRAWLDGECRNDPELRGETETLLKRQEEADRFFDEAAPQVLAGLAVAGEQPGDRIGRYLLIRRIGEGGSGVVYEAEQLEPVRRRVAIKIIKLGMDTRSFVARFEAERQALAMMDYPNIAMVLDAGATETGRPYYVMELVAGVCITAYCDEHRLSIPERLGMFVRVCRAVQHAHQKGIIHRDLKPSNILVAPGSDGPVIKVIDFGLAKATRDHLLDGDSLITREEWFMGTPAYMSPEQSEAGGQGVDTRTDIYSLGVLLYELLTGQLPVAPADLRGDSPAAIRDALHRAEPVKPSSRLRSLPADTLREAALRRRVDSGRLTALVRGDLDGIVLKALEKDRARRYDSAASLAEDVTRHLKHEPVIASQPGTFYTLRKLVRRHRVAVGAVSAITVSLVSGLGISTWLFLRERDARRDAVDAGAAEAVMRLRADQNAEESRRRLVRFNVAAGNKLLEDGDNFLALLRFVEALNLDAGHPVEEQIHRRRCALLLRHSPTLQQMWFVHGQPVYSGLCGDSSLLFTAALPGGVQVWDSVGGQPVGPGWFEAGGAECFVAPDGKRMIVRPSAGGLFQVPLPPAGKALQPVEGDIGPGAPTSQSADGRFFAAPITGGIGIYSLMEECLRPMKVLPVEGRQFLDLSGTGDLLASADGSGNIQIHEVATGAPRADIPAGSRIFSMQFSHDGGRLAVITQGRRHEVSVRDVRTGAEEHPAIVSGHDLFACRFSPDDQLLATASWDGTARLWNRAGQSVGDAMRHKGGVYTVEFRGDGKTMATTSWDGTARLWNTANCQPCSPRLHHAGLVTFAEFSRDGNRLITGAQDSAVRLWKLTDPESESTVLASTTTINRVILSPDSNRLLACGSDHLALIVDTATNQVLQTLRQTSEVRCGAWNGDGSRVLIGNWDGTVSMADAATGRPVLPVFRHGGPVTSVEFSPSGQWFVSSSFDGTARVCSTKTGQPVYPPLKHPGRITRACFSPDGAWLLTAGMDGTARLWNAVTGQPVGEPIQHDGEVRTGGFSPDGGRFVTATWDDTAAARVAQIWDTATLKPVGAPMMHTDGIMAVTFSPDGKWVATAGDDNRAMVWDARTGRRAIPLLPHEAYVFHLCFSPDSRSLLTVSADGTARVWDIATGEPVTPPLRHGNSVVWGAWSGDGNSIYTGCEDGRVRRFDLSPSALPLPRLRTLVELLAAHRLDNSVGMIPLTAEEMRARWEEVRPGR